MRALATGASIGKVPRPAMIGSGHGRMYPQITQIHADEGSSMIHGQEICAKSAQSVDKYLRPRRTLPT